MIELALIVWLVCAFAAASIASSKGNGGCAGFLLGFFFGPLGVLLVACLPASRTAVAVANQVAPGPIGSCPYCCSLIPMAARVCRFCQRDLYETDAPMKRVTPALTGACAHEQRVPESRYLESCVLCGKTFLRP